jgi:hypothetical protein
VSHFSAFDSLQPRPRPAGVWRTRWNPYRSTLSWAVTASWFARRIANDDQRGIEPRMSWRLCAYGIDHGWRSRSGGKNVEVRGDPADGPHALLVALGVGHPAV